MTRRKPAGMSHEGWVEQLLNEARRDGRYTGEEGRGLPIPDLDKPYDPMWWAKSYLRREGLSVLPPELELRRKIADRVATLKRIRQEDRVREIVEELNGEIRHHNATVISGPASGLSPLDAEAVVSAWRRSR